MATTVEWKNLPLNVLSILAKLLNSDVDNLRLRSVCSSLRSSLPLPHKPISFPLKLPAVPLDPMFPWHRQGEMVPSDLTSTATLFDLDEITLYRISPPSDDDSSNGWLLRAISQTKSNTFTLLNPVNAQEMRDPIPKHLNLLDHRISEISKYHNVRYTGDDLIMGMVFDRCFKKVIALSNYLTDCEFAALVLQTDGSMNYWKLGDEDWTPIETKQRIDDVILFKGKCYAVKKGVVFYLDSELNLKVVAALPLALIHGYTNYLVEYNSELYVLWYINFYICDGDYEEPWQMRLAKLNECNGSLVSVLILPDVVFILSEEASHCFNANDFAGFKGNRVYVIGDCFDFNLRCGVTLFISHAEDSAREISPPGWLRD